MEENLKYETIKKLVETDGNKKRAAIHLGCSLRHINRMIKGYKEKGKAFFVHGNRGRKPSHAIDQSTKDLIVNLYQTKYWGANFKHFSELLEKYEGINISPSCVYSILMSNYIISPKATRLTKKNIKKTLEAKKAEASSKKEVAEISNKISQPIHSQCIMNWLACFMMYYALF